MLWVAVVSLKGGVGKTTVATNLASAFHLSGQQTLVVDQDPQGSAYEWFWARSDTSPLSGLVVVKADKALTFPKLRELSRGCDVVVSDTPPRMGDVARSAAVAADVVVVPVRAGAADWWASKKTLLMLDEADSMRAVLGRDPVRRVFMLNAVVGGAGISKKAAQRVGALAGEFGPALGHRVSFGEAMEAGESVLTLPPQRPLPRGLKKLLHDPEAAAQVQVLYEAVRLGTGKQEEAA